MKMIGHDYKLVDAKLLLVSISKQGSQEKLSDTRGLKKTRALRRVGSNKISVGRRRGMVAGRLCHDVPQGLKPVLPRSFGTTEVVPSRPMSHPVARRRRLALSDYEAFAFSSASVRAGIISKMSPTMP